jgi:radical SAM superfamily enzyme with C-terminal helix-hairpin-helix motif
MVYQRQDRRIVAWVPAKHVSLFRKLATYLHEPLFLLYVLVVPRTTADPGRYESTEPLELGEVDQFLNQYAGFLEGDGRHHLWVCSTDGSGRIVYDRHEMLFMYGDLDAFEFVLTEEGFEKGEPPEPFQHIHFYNAEFDCDERSITGSPDFRWCALKPGDEV